MGARTPAPQAALLSRRPQGPLPSPLLPPGRGTGAEGLGPGPGITCVNLMLVLWGFGSRATWPGPGPVPPESLSSSEAPFTGKRERGQGPSDWREVLLLLAGPHPSRPHPLPSLTASRGHSDTPQLREATHLCIWSGLPEAWHPVKQGGHTGPVPALSPTDCVTSSQKKLSREIPMCAQRVDAGGREGVAAPVPGRAPVRQRRVWTSELSPSSLCGSCFPT